MWVVSILDARGEHCPIHKPHHARDAAVICATRKDSRQQLTAAE